MALYRGDARRRTAHGGTLMTASASDSRPATTDALDILHLDDHLIALNKPAGLLSVPGRTEPDCLEARAQALFPDALTVHRLDMATSGVMVMARGKSALAHLQQQFEKRETQKTYIAVVHGRMERDAGTIDAPLRCDWPNRPRQIVCYAKGRSALTHWHVLDRQADGTRLMLTPITGRSHQLRVHMAIIGHSIIGDPWYGGRSADAQRLYLHAEQLRVRHPHTDAPLTLTARTSF